MNAVPALLMLMYGDRLTQDPAEKKLWILFAWGALLCMPLAWLLAATTAVERVAPYFISLQLFVFSRLPRRVGDNASVRAVIVLVVTCYYAAVLYVWLVELSTHVEYWLSYRMWPFA
jgi:hypothetical protein